MPHDIIIEDRIYLREKAVPASLIKGRYAFHLYDESKCAHCPELPGRPSDVCFSCPAQAYHGHFRFFEKKRSNKTGASYVSLPLADYPFIRDLARKRQLEVVDRTKSRLLPMRRKLRFTGHLFKKGDKDDNGYERADQETMVKSWLRYKCGIIRAAPRSGKTIMAANIACHLQVRTLIIAHQGELLRQFLSTFVGDEATERKAMTSATKYAGLPRKQQQVVIARNFKEVCESKADVVIATAASFYHHLKDRKVARRLRGKFGFLVVDEAHRLFANKFADVVAQIPVRYRLGLTATDERLDDRDRMRNMLIGGVVASSSHVAMTPHIELIRSKSVPPTDYKAWPSAMSWVARDKVRNGEIVDEVFKRLKQGHKCVAVPVETKLHMRTLVALINERCEDEGYDPGLAVKLEAGTRERKEIIRRADQTTEPFVIVPISRIFKDGLDLRALSCVIRPVPSASEEGKGAPMFRQGAFRCATPAKNKKQPVVVLMFDNLTMFRNQMRRLFWNELKPGIASRLYHVPDDVFKELSRIPRWLKPGDIKKASKLAVENRSKTHAVGGGGLWGSRF